MNTVTICRDFSLLVKCRIAEMNIGIMRETKLRKCVTGVQVKCGNLVSTARSKTPIDSGLSVMEY